MQIAFRNYDFSGNAAGSYDPTIGRLIPSSVRHSRLVVSLAEEIFVVGMTWYAIAFETSIGGALFPGHNPGGAVRVRAAALESA